jgi:hypothetical protein
MNRKPILGKTYELPRAKRADRAEPASADAAARPGR